MNKEQIKVLLTYIDKRIITVSKREAGNFDIKDSFADDDARADVFKAFALAIIHTKHQRESELVVNQEVEIISSGVAARVFDIQSRDRKPIYKLLNEHGHFVKEYTRSELLLLESEE